MRNLKKSPIDIVQIGFAVVAQKHRELKMKAAAEGLTIREILVSLLDKYLAGEIEIQ